MTDAGQEPKRDIRDELAAERTDLAWWRTGLASLAVAVGVGRLGPELATNSPSWPYLVIGTGFSLFAIACFVRGRAVTSDTEGRTHANFDLLLGYGAVALSVAVIVLILLG